MTLPTVRQTQAELLAHLRGAVEDVFHTMLHSVVTVVERPRTSDEARAEVVAAVDPRRVQVEAVVEFHGPQSGALVLQCTAEGALDITRGLLMLDATAPATLAEVEDAIGECANMVTGALKTRAFDPHGSFRLSVPRIGTRPLNERTARAGRLVFRMCEGRLAIEIWLDPGEES